MRVNCNHGVGYKHTLVTSLSLGSKHEIWRCECGALINIADEQNVGGKAIPMTADQIDHLIMTIVGIGIVTTRTGIKAELSKVTDFGSARMCWTNYVGDVNRMRQRKGMDYLRIEVEGMNGR